MSSIHLTIDPSYCSDWGFWHGIREFVQNAKDADEFLGSKMHVEHNAKSKTLSITTADTSVSADSLLLLGSSTKRKGDQRGKFGEGFALGMLALTRAEHPVTIYNADEVWRPVIEKASDGPFANKDILKVKTRRLGGRRPHFTIEVENISADVWAATRKLFLFLDPPSDMHQVRLHSGTVLLHPDYQGMVFSKGIFVCKVPELEAGYDLQDLTLDRDRHMVDEWDLRYKLGELWTEAHNAEPAKFAKKLYEMVKRGASETKALVWRADHKLLQAMRKEFLEEHGEDAIAVSNMTEAKEVSDLGATAIVVDRTLQEILEKTTVSVNQRKEQLRGAIRARYAWNDLTEAEQCCCEVYVNIVTKNYAVVDFNDTSTNARYESDQVLVARSLLNADPRDLTLHLVAAEAKGGKRTVEQIYLSLLFGTPA